jgi:hypothetical protein
MAEVDTSWYDSRVQLLWPVEPAPLGPGVPREPARPHLHALAQAILTPPAHGHAASPSPASLGGRPVVDLPAARGCLAGLWLAHHFLDESHRLSQETDTPEGSYWHGIMHRREPDYANAKYWFRRVPQHPIHAALAQRAAELAQQSDLDEPARFLRDLTSWDAFRFVDLCEAIARGRSRCAALACQIAQVEWELLFDYCYRRAIGLPAA